MAVFNKDELLKLSPRERLARLRKIEKEMDEEKEETENLLQDTLLQLQNLEVIERIESPEPEPVDISKLFETNEGLEASVSEVSSDENDKSQYMVNTYEGGNLGHHIQDGFSSDRVEDTMYSRKNAVESEKVANQTDSSKSVIDSIKKYTRG